MRYLFGDKVIIYYKKKLHLAIYLDKHGTYTSYIAIQTYNNDRGFTVTYIENNSIFDYDETLYKIEDGDVKVIKKFGRYI